MAPENFCYWLQGFFEITNAGKNGVNLVLTPDQVDMINKHLQSVFKATIMLPPLGPATDDVMKRFIDDSIKRGGTGSPTPTHPYTVTCSTSLAQSELLGTIEYGKLTGPDVALC